MTGLPHLASLAIVVVAIIGFFVAVFVGVGPTIAEQVTQLATSVATGVTNISQQVMNAADKQKLLQDFDITKLLSQFSPWNIAGARCLPVSPAFFLILGRSSAPCPWCWSPAATVSISRCGSSVFMPSCSSPRAACSRP